MPALDTMRAMLYRYACLRRLRAWEVLVPFKDLSCAGLEALRQGLRAPRCSRDSA